MENENGWKSVYGNGILCLKAVKFASWNNSQLRNADDRVRRLSTFSFFFLVLVLLFLVCLASLLRVALCYPYVFVCYPYVARMYSYVTRMYSYVTRM